MKVKYQQSVRMLYAYRRMVESLSSQCSTESDPWLKEIVEQKLSLLYKEIDLLKVSLTHSEYSVIER